MADLASLPDDQRQALLQLLGDLQVIAGDDITEGDVADARAAAALTADGPRSS